MPDHSCNDAVMDYKETKPLAMAYVPWQKEPDIFEDLEKAYRIGTVFPVLDLPFCGKR